MNLKYAGEGIFFLGVAYRLLAWALGAVREGDAPPSAFVATPSALGLEGLGPVAQANHTGHDIDPGREAVDPTAWYQSPRDPDAPPGPGNAALFPPEMLAAMTPEQRESVLNTLAKRSGGVPSPGNVKS